MNTKWKDIYNENVRLDKIFDEKYEYDKNRFNKNCIEFLVELGEFVNETKCFKYWSIKKPDKNKVLDEFADTITMILHFYYILDIDIDNNVNLKNDELLKLINETYKLGTKLMGNLNEELVRKIFLNLLSIGNIINIKEEEMINAIMNKQRIIEERLNSDY